MNNLIIIEIIKNSLSSSGFNFIDQNDEITNIKLNNLPCAIIKETNSTIQNIHDNGYITLHYELTLLAKDNDVEPDKYSNEKLKCIIFDTLRELLKHHIITQISLDKLTSERAKYTIHNEISTKAIFTVNTIYNKI